MKRNGAGAGNKENEEKWREMKRNEKTWKKNEEKWKETEPEIKKMKRNQKKRSRKWRKWSEMKRNGAGNEENEEKWKETEPEMKKRKRNEETWRNTCVFQLVPFYCSFRKDCSFQVMLVFFVSERFLVFPYFFQSFPGLPIPGRAIMALSSGSAQFEGLGPT